MSESFVDLTYRGLPLGRRIKLTQVRPSTGYLEMPTPMPVGTAIAIATDDGVTLEALVTEIHEQVGGIAHAPGMLVRPTLAEQPIAAWWSARVTLPELEPAPPPPPREVRPRTVTVRPRSNTAVTPPPAGADEPTEFSAKPPTMPPPLADLALGTQPLPTVGRAQTILGTGPQTIFADEPPATERSGALSIAAEEPPAGSRVDSSGLLHTISAEHDTTAPNNEGRTTIMPAVDQQLLEQLSSESGAVERLTRTSGEYAVVDDGQRTTAMDAVDPATLGLDMNALGLERSASGKFRSVEPEDRPSGEIEAVEDVPSDGTSSPVTSGVKKRRRKKS